MWAKRAENFWGGLFFRAREKKDPPKNFRLASLALLMSEINIKNYKQINKSINYPTLGQIRLGPIICVSSFPLSAHLMQPFKFLGGREPSHITRILNGNILFYQPRLKVHNRHRQSVSQCVCCPSVPLPMFMSMSTPVNQCIFVLSTLFYPGCFMGTTRIQADLAIPCGRGLVKAGVSPIFTIL